MLRDLGGLLYEIHRTAGGDVHAHAPIVAAKVQRIVGLDAEARALETALAAPRGDALVFQPGIGGTCAACGELYGSGARFCSSCGAPTADAPPPVPEMPAPPDAPATEAAPESAPQGDEAPTRALPAATAESAARNGREAEHGTPDRPAADPLAPEQSRP
jgi:hypothetical protein